jgi:ABC-2 type transport system permease protein
MIRSMPIAAVTLRNLLDRRRFWLMVFLAAVPVLIMLAATAFSDTTMNERRFDQLIIRTVLPLIALVFGTGALGSELEDGTIVYLLTKPIRRFRIALAKGTVAAGLTAALIVPATMLTGLIASLQEPSMVGPTVAYAVAAAVGGTAYALAFMALSSVTSRALAVGLGYVLLWEGVLSGLFEGTRVFSIRQATLGLGAGLQGAPWDDTLDAGTSVVFLSIVIGGSLLLASWRLSRYQFRGGD